MTEERLTVWVSNLFNLVPLPRPCTAVLFGIVLFAVGLVIAAATGLFYVYVSTRLFWFAAVGGGWVAGWLAWGSDTYPKLLSAIYDVVDVSRSTREYNAKAKQRMSSSITHFLIALALTTVGFVTLYFAIQGLTADPEAPAILGVPRVLPAVFYDGQKLLSKLGLLLCPLFVGSLVLVTAIDLFYWDLGIMARLSRERLVVPYLLSLPRLDDIGAFHAKTATSWFGGVAIVIIALELQFTPLAVALVVLLSSIGLVIFAAPQYYWHTKLKEEKQDLLKALALAIKEVETFSKPYPGDANWLEKMSVHLQVCNAAASLRTWTFESQNVLQVILAFSVPIVSAVLRFST